MGQFSESHQMRPMITKRSFVELRMKSILTGPMKLEYAPLGFTARL